MSAATPVGGDPTFGDYGRILRRRSWLVLLFLIIGAVGGLVAAKVITKSYEATTVVQVLSTPTDASTDATARTTDGLNLDTEAQLVTSATVATAAATQLGVTTTPAKLAEKVTVTVPANSSLLRITFTAHKATSAEAGSLAFARSYLANRTAVATATLKANVTVTAANLKPLEAALTAQNAVVATAPDASTAKQDAQTQVLLLTQQIQTLNAQLAPLQTTVINAGLIVTNPVLPKSPSAPSVPLYVGGGALIGLLIGLLAAGMAQVLDKRMHGTNQIERDLELPVLARIELSRGADATALLRPTTKAGRAIGALRNDVVGNGTTGGVIAVCSIDDEESGSLVAAGLASALATTDGRATLLTTTGSGSAALVLAGLPEGGEAAGTATSTTRENLKIVQVPLEDGLLARAGRAITSAKLKTGFAVLETAPVSTGPTAQGLATYVDSVVLVVRDHRTRSTTALAAIRQFDKVGAEVLGLVVVPKRSIARPRVLATGSDTTTADQSQVQVLPV